MSHVHPEPLNERVSLPAAHCHSAQEDNFYGEPPRKSHEEHRRFVSETRSLKATAMISEVLSFSHAAARLQSRNWLLLRYQPLSHTIVSVHIPYISATCWPLLQHGTWQIFRGESLDKSAHIADIKPGTVYAQHYQAHNSSDNPQPTTMHTRLPNFPASLPYYQCNDELGKSVSACVPEDSEPTLQGIVCHEIMLLLRTGGRNGQDYQSLHEPL